MATDTGVAVGRTPQVGDRLPVAPRQRRPALAALAVLLILGGGLISAVLVLRSGQKETVVVIREDVAAGQAIEPKHLASAQVAVPDGIPSVPWAQRTEVVGLRAQSDLRRGTILHPQAVAATVVLDKGQQGVGLELKPDQLPANGLKVGDHVRIYYTPPANATQSGSGPQPTPPPDVLVQDATVIEKAPSRNDGTVTITVVVSESQALALARQNRLKAITLVILPKVR